jgi:hypothetical protein
MLAEFLVPVATLCFWIGLSLVSLNQLCQLHQIYQATAARLQGERWLLDQCADPHFFANMHAHTDLCLTVENNARVGAGMLALREFTQGLLQKLGDRGWLVGRLITWPGFVLAAAAVVLLGPSWVALTCRGVQVRRWPECRDRHFKDA